MDILIEILANHTIRTVAIGAGIIGFVSGSLGAFAFLRRQSLLGDAISHATLPGVALLFLLTLSKEPITLLFGAALAGILGVLLITLITRYSSLHRTTALGIILSVFFGFGIVLLTIIQEIPTAAQAGLSTFLFGNAATLLQRDIEVMVILSIISLLLLAMFWNQFKLVVFDPDFALSLGFPVGKLDIFLTCLLVIAIIIGLQTVGVILMSAMVVGPAAAARQWTNRLDRMVILSGAIGAGAGVIGSVISGSTTKLPTGPVIIVIVTLLVVISFFFSPNRGLLWEWARIRRNRGKLELFNALSDFLHESSPEFIDKFPSEIAVAEINSDKDDPFPFLEALEGLGWIHRISEGYWGLTYRGLREAKRIELEEVEKYVSPN
ncbi:MAG: metal ABC transporter permease [Candidatus Thorarchaeota archaeon]